MTKHEIAAFVAEAVAQVLAKQGNAKAKTAKAKPANANGLTDRQVAIEKLTKTAFKKAGFGEVTPKVDVLTYGKWAELGFKVKPGEKAVKVKQFRLFHKSQVEAATADEATKNPNAAKPVLGLPKGDNQEQPAA